MKNDVLIMLKSHMSSVMIAIICFAIAIGILFVPIGKQTPKYLDLSEYSSIDSICELATLRSFYHNVAIYEEQPGGGNKFVNDVVLWPIGGFIKTGYKQFWMEYSGIVETGIDASQIQINTPNAQGIVDVFIPDAKVLSVYADENSLSVPIRETGMFTTITGENQADAFAMAQSAMREEAENDKTLLKRAKNNAKLLLERYIINTGKEMGVDYLVNWIDNPV